MKGKQMKKARKWIKDVWEKVWKWMKKTWKIATVMFFCFIICFIINQQKLTISDKIQAWTIITLVFITGIYAYLTYKIVKEAEKKRKADYWEKRINEFYQPFIVKLNNIKEELYNEQKDTKKMNEVRNDAQCFFWKKKYMISQETVKKIEEWQLTIFEAEIDGEKESFKKYYEAEKEVRTTINNEWNEVEDKIRKFYGY